MQSEAVHEKEGGTLQKSTHNAVFAILLAVSFSHLLNDTIQAILPAIYPLLQHEFKLSFAQVGFITLAFQLTASVLQPLVGLGADRRPFPYSLAFGMGLSLGGVLLLAFASSFGAILIAAALIGTGSSVFHPEASRVARMASGGRHGFAQSLFQVGGNAGTAIGPLLAAAIVVPRGQAHIAWFSVAALLGITVLLKVGRWYQERLAAMVRKATAPAEKRCAAVTLSRGRIIGAIVVLMALIFSKYFYLACVTSYYTFFLIHKFHVSIQASQVCLFVFLGAVAAGTIIGGPVGDRFGRKFVIWLSILGSAPFALALPYVSLPWVIALSVPIGLILSSAFSAILVYAQELMPGRVGLVAGLFFGFAFGMGGIGSAVLGVLADWTSIENVFTVCSFLPLIGLLTGLLPEVGARRTPAG